MVTKGTTGPRDTGAGWTAGDGGEAGGGVRGPLDREAALRERIPGPGEIDPRRTAGRLGPVLFQLPPALRCDEALLADFLSTLPQDSRYAFEFRHPSWLSQPVYSLLEKHGVALCLAESEKLVAPEVITSNFVYSRLRKEDYSAEDRQEIARRVEQLLGTGRDVYVFFKHEETPAGAFYAEELLHRFQV